MLGFGVHIVRVGIFADSLSCSVGMTADGNIDDDVFLSVTLVKALVDS